MWVNPSSTTLGAPALLIDESMGIGGGLTHFILRYNNSSASAEYLLDEFRVSNDLRDALGIVIPEPSSALLVLIGAGLLIFRRHLAKL
jgi:hypothetical protein